MCLKTACIQRRSILVPSAWFSTTRSCVSTYSHVNALAPKRALKPSCRQKSLQRVSQWLQPADLRTILDLSSSSLQVWLPGFQACKDWSPGCCSGAVPLEWNLTSEK